MLVRRREEQQLGGVRGAAGQRRRGRRRTSSSRRPAPRRLPVTAEPSSFVSSLTALRVRDELDVRMLERRPHAEHLGVRLPVHGADEAVAVRAADARAVRHVRLVQANPARCVERVQAGRLEVVRELLDPRLVRDGRERILRARESFRRILAVVAVHLVVAARPSCSTARARRRRSARRARRRRGAAARRSPRVAAGRGRRRRASSPRPRSSGSAAGTACPSRRTRCPRTRSGCRRRRPGRASSAARGAASRRARAAGCACPDGARWRASVPPPAPDPMMITSYASTGTPFSTAPSARAR